MSAQELTKKIELLSKEDFDMIVSLVNRLTENEVPFKYLTKDALVEELTASTKASDEGGVISAKQFSEDMRNKYAI